MLKNSMMGHQILVSASACCTVEQEVKEESTTVIAELSAELQREKQKNAELMERISVLESQVQAKQKVLELTNGKASCQSMEERHFRKLKKQKVAQYIETNEDRKEKVVSEVKDHTENFLTKDVNTEKCLVNWMSMDDTQFLIFERSKDSDSAADNDSNDSEDEDDEESDDIGIYDDDIHREKVKNLPIKKEIKEQVLNENLGEASDPAFLETRNNLETSLAQTCLKHNVTSNTRGHDNCNNKDIKMLESCEEPLIACQIDHGIKIQRNPFPQKKSLKVAFCPKEVKKILGSRELSLENAQSHTMRKIIVFSPFGTRHGCEDMYELDFNHFSILHKGQSYIDLNNPGEHVLYHNPGIRRKIFFPNRQNPTLCPVQILEEEKTMRPTDASCPSWLFLCIKYGGRTRNLPQNEYVRQRMGRNKLKSFGPVICRMAMLVHIRSGSFFFKALGITLLFMAGFSNDLVQRETKYRNLDLLQKYYRRDEDAEREELFLSHSETDTTNISPNTQHAKKVSTKSKRKSEAISKSKPSQEVTMIPSQPSCSASPAPFGLMNYASSPSQMTVSVPSSQTLADMQKPVMANAAFNIPYHNQCSYPLFPMHPPNSAVPFAYWPQLNAFPPFPHPSSPHPSFYRYLTPGSCISVHPYSYYSHLSFNPLIPETLGTEKQNERSDKAERDSSSSSSSTDSRKK